MVHSLYYFCVHEYRSYAYIWLITDQPRFLFDAQLKAHFNFMRQILVNTFSQIKIKMKRFGSSCYNYIVFHYYNDLIKLLQSSLVILLCLILFFCLFELLLAFICANLLLFVYTFSIYFFYIFLIESQIVLTWNIYIF